MERATEDRNGAKESCEAASQAYSNKRNTQTDEGGEEEK